MKKIFLVLLTILAVFVLASCASTSAAEVIEPVEEPSNWLDNAAAYIKALFDKSSKQNPAPRTTADFEVYDHIEVKGQAFDIAWSTDTEYVTVEPKENHVVLINIDEAAPEETVYNLIAVVSDAEGTEITLTMPKTLPQGSSDPSYEEIVLAAYKLGDGEALPKNVRLAGVVTEIPTVYSEQYKNITVNMQIGAMAENIIQAYRLSGEGSEAIKVGDVITVEGQIKNYKGTIEFNKPVLVGFGDVPEQSATLEKAFLLADGEVMKGTQIIVGTIESIPSAYSEKYGNITVNLIPTGDTRVVQAYRLTGGADLAVGDTITVIGTIKNYKGTIEFDKGCRYVSADAYIRF